MSSTRYESMAYVVFDGQVNSIINLVLKICNKLFVVFVDAFPPLVLDGVQELRIVLFPEPGVVLSIRTQSYSILTEEGFMLLLLPVLFVLVIGPLCVVRVYPFVLNL